jgi:radical SAM-linked protein
MPETVEKLNHTGFGEYGLLPAPRTYRLRFCKTGGMQWISHLDLQRSFARILARADLPLWFTEGFNPHPKIVFALPLPVGCQSLCELVDIRLVRDMPCDEVLRRMHGATASNLDFDRCYVPASKFIDIRAAEWEVRIDGRFVPGGTEDYLRRAEALLTGPSLTVVKRTKSGDRETDIIPLIKSVRCAAEGSEAVLRLCLAAGQAENLSPELVVSVLRDRLGIPEEDREYTVMRLRMLDGEMKEFL